LVPEWKRKTRWWCIGGWIWCNFQADCVWVLLDAVHDDPSDVNARTSGKKKNPLEFLGENSNLVNLDNLLPPAKSASPIFGGTVAQQNPFGGASLLSAPSMNGGVQVVNPFQSVIQKPSINEIREKQLQGMAPTPANSAFGQSPQPQNNPWSPVKPENPFFNWMPLNLKFRIRKLKFRIRKWLTYSIETNFNPFSARWSFWSLNYSHGKRR